MAKKEQKGPTIQVYDSVLRSDDAGNNWYWRLLAKNGQVIADGAEGYASKGNAKRAARRARELMAKAEIAA